MGGEGSSGIGRGGRQRASRKGWLAFYGVGLALLGLGFVGYGVYDYAEGSGDAASPAAQATASIVALAVGLAFLAAGVYLLRRAFPPRARGYVIEANSAQLRRGEDFDVWVRIAEPDKVAEGALVGLVCLEYYSVTKSGESGDYRDDEEATVFEDWRPLRPGDPRPCERFRVPPDAPYSHEGAYLSYHWLVRVRETVLRGRDRHHDGPIWVRP